MTPCLAIDRRRDTVTASSERPGERTIRSPVRIRFTKLLHKVFGQTPVVTRFPSLSGCGRESESAPLGTHVGQIVGLACPAKMRSFYTRRIITGVRHNFFGQQRFPGGQLNSDAVRSFQFGVVVVERTVSTSDEPPGRPLTASSYGIGWPYTVKEPFGARFLAWSLLGHSG